MKFTNRMVSIILASKSKVRKEILEKHGIPVKVEPSNVDEDIVKKSLLKENATPEIISKNLAELKANKISQKRPNQIVLGADSVIDLNGEIISKPSNRAKAFEILKSQDEEDANKRAIEFYNTNTLQKTIKKLKSPKEDYNDANEKAIELYKKNILKKIDEFF